ncbi:MAG: cytidine deaminase [Fimbriimonadaceae bacterium]|nr:cytidine deaminase [Fimbriimonadaceae bacterium]QYK59613.1 MAG: cytidine deaminase [Fimbriimonadaceae bacterium]
MKELLAAATAVRANAYAPYSVYLVGAAVLGSDGQIYAGCNVENVSFGATLCAERSAVSAMVAAGCSEIMAVAVVTRDGGLPCGICVQTMLEFAPDPSSVPVCCMADGGPSLELSLADLAPHSFRTNLKNQ